MTAPMTYIVILKQLEPPRSRSRTRIPPQQRL